MKRCNICGVKLLAKDIDSDKCSECQETLKVKKKKKKRRYTDLKNTICLCTIS